MYEEYAVDETIEDSFEMNLYRTMVSNIGLHGVNPLVCGAFRHVEMR